MRLSKEDLQELVDEVIYPIEKLLEEQLGESGASSEDAIKTLKDVGFLNAALVAFDETLDREAIQKRLEVLRSIHSLSLEQGFAAELLSRFFDLLIEFSKRKNPACVKDQEACAKRILDLKEQTDANSLEDAEDEDEGFLDFDEQDDAMIDQMHYSDEEKISAAEYMQSDYIDYELLDDIGDMLSSYDGVRDSYPVYDDEFKQQVVDIFRRFVALFELSGEFRDLAKTIDYLIAIVDQIDAKRLDESQKQMLKLFLDAIMDDLEKWYEEVVRLQSAQDIHYLDASLLASIKQIAELFGIGQDSGGGTPNQREHPDFFVEAAAAIQQRDDRSKRE